MSVNLGCADVFVAELFLDGSDIRSSFQKMSRERMAKCMTARWFGNACFSYGDFNCPLNRTFIKVMSSCNPGTRVKASLPSRKNVLPSPFFWGIRVFSRERIG